MASLLESTICSLRMGRGVCGCATNTVLGCGAGGLYTTGVRNSAIGNEAGRATSGVDKVSLGCRAGLLSFSSRNVFAGTIIGSSNYYGTDNVAVGQNNNYFGTYRTVSVGTQVFRAGNATNAVALGRLSFCASVGCVVGVGVNAGRTANNDNHIVAIGESAGQYSSGAGSNTIGACAGRFGGNPNTTQIGFYAYGGNYAPNRFVIGKYGFSCSQVYVAWSNVSDSRDKTNVTNLPDNLGLNFIRKLRPVSFKFDYRKEYMYKCGFEYGDKDGTLKRDEINYGFLAQEIKNASDELNVTFDGVTYDSLDDSYGLKTYELISPIVKAIQEINEELDLIEQQIT